MDINDVTFYAIAPDDETLAYVIDPPSDTKEVVIPSPPSKKTVKINPREAVILFTKEPITEAYSELDALKAYITEQTLKPTNLPVESTLRIFLKILLI